MECCDFVLLKLQLMKHVHGFRTYQLAMQVLGPATSFVLFRGERVSAEAVTVYLENAVSIRRDIPGCVSSTSNAIKAVLLGREVANGVWMWRKTVLQSWDKFCSVVNAELQDEVGIDLTAMLTL